MDYKKELLEALREAQNEDETVEFGILTEGVDLRMEINPQVIENEDGTVTILNNNDDDIAEICYEFDLNAQIDYDEDFGQYTVILKHCILEFNV